MQNKPIIYNSLTVAAKNGLDIELTWNVGDHFGKLGGSGKLEEVMNESLRYNDGQSFKRPDVTRDLTELFELAKAANWNWESTRIAAIEKTLQECKSSSQD